MDTKCLPLPSTMALVSIGLLLSTPAHAYVDPGTGTMLLQMGAAAVAAGMFYMRNVRNWVMGLFRRDRSNAGDGTKGSEE